MFKKIEPKEALKVLKDNIHYSLYELNEATKNDTNSRLIRSIRALDELVDKATPLPRIKPKDSFYLWACPNCKTDFIDNQKSKYCTECGQRFEGSEND